MPRRTGGDPRHRRVKAAGDPLVGPADGCEAHAARSRFRGDDQAKLQVVLDEAFTPHETEVVGRRPLEARFDVVHRGNISVFDLSYGTDVVLRPVRPPDYFAIRVGHLGRAVFTSEQRTMRFSPTIVNPGQVLTARWEASASARIMCVPKAMVEDAVRGELGDLPDKPVLFENVLDTGIRGVAEWVDLAARFSAALDSGLLAGSPLSIAHFEHLVVHSMVRLTRHDLSDAIAGRSATAGPLSLRRAIAFCEENAACPISVGQMAAAALVSTRTLYDLFRTHLNTTPLTHLRRVRLSGAHADLVSVAEGRAAYRTVAHIAQRWGFPHTGRFSRLYHSVYGRFPSETIRASPRLGRHDRLERLGA